MGTATYFSPEQAQGAQPRPAQRPLLARHRDVRDGRPAARRSPATTRSTIAYKQVHEAPGAAEPGRARRARRPYEAIVGQAAGQEPGAALRARPTTCAPTCAASATARPVPGRRRATRARVPRSPCGAVAAAAAAGRWAHGRRHHRAADRTGAPGAAHRQQRLRRTALRPQPPRSNRGGLIAGIILLAPRRSPSAAWLLYKALSNGDAEARSSLPPVIGQPIDEAVKILQRRRLQRSTAGPARPTPRSPPDIVYAPEPASRAMVDEGQTVKLTYNPAATAGGPAQPRRQDERRSASRSSRRLGLDGRR